MVGQLQQALTVEERLRFEAALRRAPTPRAEAMFRATPYEEHVWLAQQQAPERVLKHLVACRLTGAVDLARLAGAIVKTAQDHPDLRARYRFSQDGELHKDTSVPAFGCLRMVRTESRDETVASLLNSQGEAWDSAAEPPFEAILISEPRETVLALVLNRVLDAAYPAAQLLGEIASLYAGRVGEAVRGSPGRVRLLGAGDGSARLPPWMRRGSAVGSPVIVHERHGIEPDGVAAGRFSVSVGIGLFGVAADAAPERLLASASTAIARFVSALSGSREVDLRIRNPLDAAVGDVLPAATGPGLLVVRVDGREPAEHVLQAVLTGLGRPDRADAAENDTFSRADRPTIHLGWMTDLAQVLPLEGVSVQILPLPTRESRPDLSFLIGRDQAGAALVELVTGQDLSPHIGPILLERFVAWLTEGDAALPGCLDPGSAARPPHREAAADATSANGVAELILAEFREALNAPTMELGDDFFDQGGHSLIATRVIGRLLDRHGIELRFDDLFSFPNAAALARKASPAVSPSRAAGRNTAGERAASAPLALAQASLWKAYAAFGFGEIFNLPFALDFLDPVDEALFRQAFTDVLERHPGLRSLFEREGDTVRQHVVPIRELSRHRWFWTSLESEGVDRRDEARHLFDLANELPFRIRFLTDPATGRQILSFLFHHIALDEWSVNVMMDELTASYRARASGGTPRWAETPAPFHAFAQAQSDAGVDQTHVAYWVDRLRDAPTPRPILQSERETPDADADPAAGGWVEFKLDRQTVDGLYALAKQSSASLFNVVYAGIVAALRQLGSLPELVVGTSASGRGDPAFFDTIGYFTTVVAHRIRFDDGMSVGDLVSRVRHTINDSLPYTDIPIDVVEAALGLTPGRDHLFEVFIQIHAKNKLNGALEGPDGHAIRFRQVDPERHESMLGLHFEVMEETIADQRSIRILLNYRSAHYGPREVDRITATVHGFLSQMARDGASRSPLHAIELALTAA